MAGRACRSVQSCKIAALSLSDALACLLMQSFASGLQWSLKFSIVLYAVAGLVELVDTRDLKSLGG